MTVKDKKMSPVSNVQDFNSVSIYLASPKDVRSWSCGEVKRSETINYRTLKPENDGLFCARIFGPIRDYECICGKYRRMKYRGVVCEKCGVEVTFSRVRRERMGHIELAAPVVHPWYLRSIPSRIGMILDMSVKTLEQIIYSEKYVVTMPGLSEFKERQVLSLDQYTRAQQENDLESFQAETGSSAILTLLKNVDLEASLAKVKAERAKTASSIKLRRLVKQARIIEAFMKSGNKPEWMVITVLPVLPPELRPLVPLDGGRFATSDLNDLYRRVVIRNNRLRRLQELAAPDIIVRNERRMLQKSVEALFDGSGRVSKSYQSNAKTNLKSLSDMLKGKRGRFRQNLLGKRVDYSGRSVIVVGPHLRLHQCGLPKEMALELFKPYIYARLEAEGKAETLKRAKKLVERGGDEIWATLQEVVKGHPVILNRAPTLHRLGVQAFEPVLVEGKAIQLHPLVCTAFNADFDGDQMAVHIPLSVEAQTEARVLLMSTNNILSPANGQPIIVPTQDIVLGIYYMTLGDSVIDSKQHKFYRNVGDIKYALANKKINVHDKIIFRFENTDEDGNKTQENIATTVGRALFSETLPKNPKINFNLINHTLTKGEVANLVNIIYRHCPQQEVVNFCDRIMDFGFKHACSSGISFGKDDMIIPAMKEKLVEDTNKLVSVYEKQWFEGLVTKGERRNKTIDAWSTCTDRVEKEMIKELSGDGGTNSVYLMWKSGARGSSAQMKQLAGMRGLMAKPSGEIIETPITSNFREGLNVLEYFNSTHGARKGLADTALKTADSGYLTRRLVDVAQDCVVNESDCGSEAGVWINSIIEGKITMATLAERILGRIAALDICDPSTGKVLVAKGQEINEDEVKLIVSSGIDKIKTRSVLFCRCSRGVCAKCYGRDLSRGKLVRMGEAIGTVATQSVGEPGTQLTMRTFHVGGTAQVAEESGVEATKDGSVRITNLATMTDTNNILLIMSKNSELEMLDQKGIKYASYPLPYGAKLYVKDGDKVTKGTLVAEWDPYTIPVITEASGRVNYVNLVEDVTLIKSTDEATGIVSNVVTVNASTRSYGLRPEITILDENGEVCKLASGSLSSYGLVKGAVLSVEENQLVKAGSVIARIPRASSKTRDITGGLPRVVELFEARQPSDAAVMARSSGTVVWGGTYKGKQKIMIKAADGSEDLYNIPLSCHINLQDQDKVEKGDLLVEGTPLLQDILHILGVGKLADFFIKEVQKVYRLQGVKINDKHLEVILRQMLSKVTILDCGDTDFIPGEQIDREDFFKANQEISSKGGKVAAAETVLLGITKASLQTKSFISAAAFQETTRVLTDAAIAGRTDNLLGMKENIIIGRLIPAGTGSFTEKYKLKAAEEV